MILGSIRLREGRHDEALALCRMWLKIIPDLQCSSHQNPYIW